MLSIIRAYVKVSYTCTRSVLHYLICVKVQYASVAPCFHMYHVGACMFSSIFLYPRAPFLYISCILVLLDVE